MRGIKIRLVTIGLQNHLVTALFLVVIAAVFSITSPTQTTSDSVEVTETGNPSVLFDAGKLSSYLRHQVLPSKPGIINCYVEKCIALTFDDGPENDTTPKILDELKAQAAPATFFVLGSKVHDHAKLVRRIHTEGHELGNHSWAHQPFTKLKPEQMVAELNQTNQAVSDTGVPAPKLFRPPYGSINRKVTDTLNVPIILWNTDPQDWSPSMGAKQEVSAVVNSVHAGSIVVLHDTKKGTAEALPEMIRQLRSAGFKLVTVSQLLSLSDTSRGVYYSR
jgi:peptidoglycan/xylan/chitin deacetylase (PgdA/CDA1 family)